MFKEFYVLFFEVIFLVLLNNYRFQDTFPIDYIRHRFWLSKYYSIYKRYPDTLTMGIAKVGGLVAIFKVGFFL